MVVSLVMARDRSMGFSAHPARFTFVVGYIRVARCHSMGVSRDPARCTRLDVFIGMARSIFLVVS
jgi:hypothetical protein